MDVNRYLCPTDSQTTGTVNGLPYRYDPTGANPIEFGDLVIWYPAGPYQMDGCYDNAMGPLFIGVAMDKGPTPAGNIDLTANQELNGLVAGAGIFSFVTTSGDVYSHGDALTWGAGPQIVYRQGPYTSVDTETIAFVHEPTVGAAISGDGVNTIRVRICQNFPLRGLN